MAVQKNNLVIYCPDLIKEWHPTKNGENKPEDYTYGSGEKVWWKCSKSDCKYEWEAFIKNRAIRRRGCPECAK